MLRLARVMKIYPESRSADVVLLDAGSPLVRVPILGGSTSGNTGGFDVPPAQPSGSDYLTGDREMIAVVAPLAQAGHVIIGFMMPAVRQGVFTDPERMTYRHQSDAYFTVDGRGNAEFYHPSGTFVRIGEGGHEDLTGQDLDGIFDLGANLASAPTITVGVAAAGVSKATLTIGPTGAVTLATEDGVTITAPSGIAITGDLTVTGEVTANGVALSTHAHSGVTSGAETSGAPVV